jgi:hypothetical protein
MSTTYLKPLTTCVIFHSQNGQLFYSPFFLLLHFISIEGVKLAFGISA